MALIEGLVNKKCWHTFENVKLCMCTHCTHVTIWMLSERETRVRDTRSPLLTPTILPLLLGNKKVVVEAVEVQQRCTLSASRIMWLWGAGHHVNATCRKRKRKETVLLCLWNLIHLNQFNSEFLICLFQTVQSINKISKRGHFGGYEFIYGNACLRAWKYICSCLF